MTSKTIELFREGKLSSRQLLDVSDHLTECEACAGLSRKDPMFYKRAASIRSAISGSASETHLTYEQLEAYANKRLNFDEKKAVEDHTSSCPQCNAEIGQFRSLAALVNEVPGVTASQKRDNWIDGVWSFFNARTLVTASFAIVAILFAVSIAIWWASSDRGRQEIVADPPQVDTESPEHSDLAATVPDQAETDPAVNDSSNGNATAELRVSLNEGRRTIGLTTDGQLKGYENLPSDLNRSVRDALQSGTVRIGSDASELRAPRGALMGNDDVARGETFRLKGPAGEVIMTHTPKFSWEPLPGAEGYLVEVFDSNFAKVASSGQLNSTNWTTSLPRGKIYFWQVTATFDGRQIKAPQRPAPDAKFKVISQEQLDKIRYVQRQYPGRSLALGLTYAETGLLREALAEFDSLVRSNPSSSVPKRLRSNLQTAIRDF